MYQILSMMHRVAHVLPMGRGRLMTSNKSRHLSKLFFRPAVAMDRPMTSNTWSCSNTPCLLVFKSWWKWHFRAQCKALCCGLIVSIITAPGTKYLPTSTADMVALQLISYLFYLIYNMSFLTFLIWHQTSSFLPPNPSSFNVQYK